jgi:hypothetical protein
MEDLQNVGARNTAGHSLEEITMSDEWNGVSMAQEDFGELARLPATHAHDLTSQAGRSSIPVKLITLLFTTMALGLLACTSQETPTEPSGSASLAQVGKGTSILQSGPFPAGTTIFVDVDNTTGVENGSQAHPFNTIQEGISAASNGDAVGVAPGVYAEIFGPSLTPNYVIDGLQNFSLVGLGPAQTTIRGDHSFSLIRVQNRASVLIKGFTIEKGGRIPNSEGGGIQVLGFPGPTSLTVENVVLQDNEAVNGGAIATGGDVQLRLTNVVIANNRASNCCGGVVLETATPAVSATFSNTTITENQASHLAGGVLAERATLNLVNSIVWNNSLAEVTTFFGEGIVNVSFSDVGEALFPGPGNISLDPQFGDPVGRDYHLQPQSPAIDAGSNTGAPATDIDNKPRPIDGDGNGIAIVDMGAFEFGTPPSAIEVAIDIKPESCKNPLNVRSRGSLRAAILGSSTFDVTTIVPSSIRVLGVAAPAKTSLKDLATSFGPRTGEAKASDCIHRGPDGFRDLALKFGTEEIVGALGNVRDGDVVVLTLTGTLRDGTVFSGEDVVLILNPRSAPTRPRTFTAPPP